MTGSTVVSCPGKVLLAGGYLVLDRQHHGLVVSTPSRFYTTVRDMVRRESSTSPIHDGSFTITVDSPQFLGARWVYIVSKEAASGEWNVEPSEFNASRNPFVQISVEATVSLASALFSSSSSTLASSDLHVIIVGANDFYSQDRNSSPPASFAHLGCAISDVHKTGLGSSAAMTTSLVGALLLHFDSRSNSTSSRSSSSSSSPISRSTLSSSPSLPAKFPSALHARAERKVDRGTMTLIHNLAQYAHSLAQGKVGSGFDVSAAVWGSHIYRRFSPECLGESLGGNEQKLSSKALLSLLSPLSNRMWTSTQTAPNVAPFGLPPRLTLLLADVDAGSHTPSMVGKVLAWRKADPEQAARIWTSLHHVNGALAETFAKLGRKAKDDAKAYDEDVERLARRSMNEVDSEIFKIAAQQISTARTLMREMGERSSVPIEPPEQTRLLDAVSALPGVIGAGVPGAGGYDAIWVLALSPASTGPSPLEEVEKVLIGWKEMSVRPLSRAAWAIGGAVDQDGSGLRREKLEEVEGLKAVIEGLQV